MSQTEHSTVVTFRQQQVLNQLQGRVRTWDELRRLLKINDAGLGLTIGALLNQRKIWTAQKNDVRVYGLERRTGIMPRLSYLQQRYTDRIDTAIERRVK
jgi:hypothetical protein